MSYLKIDVPKLLGCQKIFSRGVFLISRIIFFFSAKFLARRKELERERLEISYLLDVKYGRIFLRLLYYRSLLSY